MMLNAKNHFEILKLWLKKCLYFFWRQYISICILYNSLKNNSNKKPKVFYAGAIKGDKGGPLVKIKKLTKYFPEYINNFNIVYLLSNNQHLNNTSLKIIHKSKIPIVLNQNGVFYPSWFKGDWEKENSNISCIYHLSDYVFWQSNFSKRASNKYLGERLGPGEVLYNAVDTEVFLPKGKYSDDAFTFLITGNIRKNNNYRISSVVLALKEVIKFNKKTYLKIAGYIEDKIYFLSLIKSLNLDNHISFIDKYTQKDAPQIYKGVDAYITMTFQDNCPSAVLEAMSCGLPVLYSSSGGIPELVDNNSGIGLKVPENWIETEIPFTTDIKDGMLKIIDSRKHMSDAARYRAVKYFDIKDWINKHITIFEKMIN